MNSAFAYLCLSLSFMQQAFCVTTKEQDLEQFAQANVLYNKGNYQKAFDTYRLIRDKGYPVWFNLGCCAYHLADYAQAYASWLQAEQKAPKAILYRIDHCYKKLEEKQGIYNQRLFWHNLLRHIPLFGLQSLCILLWSFFCMVLVMYTWKKHILLCCVLGAFVCASAFLVRMRYTMMQHRYVVTKSQACLYAGPNKEYHVIDSCDAFCPFIIEDTYNNEWYQVKTHAGKGWLFKDDGVSAGV